MRDRMAESRTMVESERSSKKELSYDLTRQYKTMQAQLESRIEFLESHVKRLQTNLGEYSSLYHYSLQHVLCMV